MSAVSSPAGFGSSGPRRGQGPPSSRGRGSRGGLNPFARPDNAARGARGILGGATGGRGRGGSAPPSSATRGVFGATRGGGNGGLGAAGRVNGRPASPSGLQRLQFGRAAQADRKSKSASPLATAQSNIDRTRDPRRQQRHGGPTTNGVQDYSSRYDQLKKARAAERVHAIKSGQMADPNQPTSLNRAITPTGACTDMCPEFERVERMVQKMVDKCEKYLDPETGVSQNVEAKMLKRFRRSAAGYDEQLPSDIRTPNTLLQTMNYILRHVVGNDENLGTIHKFVWDRTRSIRNDLSIQQLTQARDVEIAVKCLERIARFHIVSLHLLSHPENTEPFDHHQEREQLNNTLLSLLYYYDDHRGRMKFPNEDEFRAYYIVFSIHDQRPDLESRVQKWPQDLRQSPRVQVAMELFAAAGNTWEYQGTLDARRPNAIAQGFYTRFFNILRSDRVSYLMGCIAEIYFNQVRQTAIRSIWKAYCRQPVSQQHKNQEWTVQELTKALAFDDRDQTISFCEEQGLQLTENPQGQTYLNWADRSIDSVDFQPSSKQTFSDAMVESKRRRRNLVALILGMNVAQAVRQGMIVESIASQPGSFQSEAEEPLFVSDDETQESAPAPKFGSQFGASTNAFGTQNNQLNATPQPTGFFGLGSQANSHLSPTASPFNPLPSFASSTTQNQGQTTTATSNPFQSALPSSFGTATTGFGAPRTDKPSPPAPATSSPFAPNAAPSFSSTFKPGFGGRNPFGSLQSSPKPESTQSPFGSSTAAFGKPDNAPQFGQSQPASSTPSATTPSESRTGTPSSKPKNPLFQSFPPTSFGQPSIFNQGPQTTEAKGGIFGTPPPVASTTQLPSSAAPAPFSPLFQSAQAQTPADSGLFGAKLQSPADERAEPDDKQAKERAERDEKERRVRETREAELKARIEAERKEADRQEAEKREAERREAERRDAERKEAERREAERREAERQEAARKEADIRAAVAREAAKKEREKREREMLKRQAEEVKAAQHDIARFKAAEKKTQEREAMIRRIVEQEVTKRKSMDDEDEEQSTSSSKGKFKAPKLPQTEEPPLRIEELLTGLEGQRPPRSTPGVSKKPLIDEDELLISSARLAAHTLSQRRLFDRDMPQSLASSWSSSRSSPYMSQSYEPSTTSAGGGGRAIVNGYEVALAPTTSLGLGQSLSRTEQRIRLTGAKGLASKPIAPLLRSTSTKESSKSKSKSKSKRPRRNYSSSFGS